MPSAHRSYGAVRWVSLKTAAQLVECSVSAARGLVLRGRWKGRRLGRGRRAHLRVAIGADNFPLSGKGRA